MLSTLYDVGYVILTYLFVQLLLILVLGTINIVSKASLTAKLILKCFISRDPRLLIKALLALCLFEVLF